MEKVTGILAVYDGWKLSNQGLACALAVARIVTTDTACFLDADFVYDLHHRSMSEIEQTGGYSKPSSNTHWTD